MLGRVQAGIRRGAACGDHAALVGGQALERRHPAACSVAGDDRQALAVAHLRSIGLERGARRACDRLERILDGVGRRELRGDQRRDAVEPALAAALGERLRVLERERGQPRERARELDLGEPEGPAVGEGGDHERGPPAASPAHRHRELAANLLERGMADRVRLASRSLHGPKARDRRAGGAGARGELLALQVVIEAVRGRDAVVLARRVVHPDGRRIGTEHARGRGGELAEQDVEVELAADGLGRAHERGLREARLSQRRTHAREPEGGRRVVAAEVEQRQLVGAQRTLEPEPERAEPRIAEHQRALLERRVLGGRSGVQCSGSSIRRSPTARSGRRSRSSPVKASATSVTSRRESRRRSTCAAAERAARAASTRARASTAASAGRAAAASDSSCATTSSERPAAREVASASAGELSSGTTTAPLTTRPASESAVETASRSPASASITATSSLPTAERTPSSRSSSTASRVEARSATSERRVAVASALPRCSASSPSWRFPRPPSTSCSTLPTSTIASAADAAISAAEASTTSDVS